MTDKQEKSYYKGHILSGNEHYSYVLIAEAGPLGKTGGLIDPFGVVLMKNDEFSEEVDGTICLDNDYFEEMLDFEYQILRSTKKKWRCLKCNSEEVTIKAWINPNLTFTTVPKKKPTSENAKCLNCKSTNIKLFYPKRPPHLPKPKLPKPLPSKEEVMNQSGAPEGKV